jgi:hypothetical protein
VAVLADAEYGFRDRSLMSISVNTSTIESEQENSRRAKRAEGLIQERGLTRIRFARAGSVSPLK